MEILHRATSQLLVTRYGSYYHLSTDDRRDPASVATKVAREELGDVLVCVKSWQLAVAVAIT